MLICDDERMRRPEDPGAPPVVEDRGERPQDARACGRRSASRWRPPSAISRSQMAGKCGRARGVTAAMACDERAELLVGRPAGGSRTAATAAATRAKRSRRISR